MKATQTPPAENERVTPDPGPFFHKFLTPRRVRKQNAGSSRSRLRIRIHLWCRPFWHIKKLGYFLTFSITARSASALAVASFVMYSSTLSS